MAQPAKQSSKRQPLVDRACDALYAGFMNLQVPPELEARLTRLATETGRSVDQVALDLLASSIDHDEWFGLVVRTQQSEPALFPSLVAAIHEIRPDALVGGLTTMTERINRLRSASMNR
jgi:hypothetical protein